MRISYEGIFELPEDAEVTDLICTTMSLDVEEQLKILGCMYGNTKITVREDAFYPLLKDALNKCYFFYDVDKANLKCPEWNDSSLVTLLHGMRYPVKQRSGGVFHPKIILLRYVQNGDIFYRLQVSSRNLTVSDSFEVGVQLVGVRRRSVDVKNHNMDSFVELLAGYINNESKKEQFFSRLATELAILNFVVPSKPESEILVTVSGIANNGQDEELVRQWENENNGGVKQLHILSPDYETAKEQIERYHMVYEPIEETTNSEAKVLVEIKRMPTHAKLYYYPDRKTVWLGSCNSSKAAMDGTNIECMVRIGGMVDEVEADDEETLVVFGKKCRRITEGQAFLNNEEYDMIKLLNRFLEGCTGIKGKDRRDKKGEKRNVTVEFVMTDAAFSVLEEMKKEKMCLECLPLGMDETKSNGESKWEKLEKMSTVVRFPGGGKTWDLNNGILRIRLSGKSDREGEKKEVETQIVFDDDITRSILADNPSETYHSFFERAWLERLMRIDEFEALEKECALFYKTCEGVGKIDGITEEQKEYLAELKGMYKNVSEVIYEAVRREEYGY